MTITVPSNYQPHMDTAQVLVQQLAAVGVRATIQPIEWESWISDVYTGPAVPVHRGGCGCRPT